MVFTESVSTRSIKKRNVRNYIKNDLKSSGDHASTFFFHRKTKPTPAIIVYWRLTEGPLYLLVPVAHIRGAEGFREFQSPKTKKIIYIYVYQGLKIGIVILK